jgi:hypothetical protein
MKQLMYIHAWVDALTSSISSAAASASKEIMADT